MKTFLVKDKTPTIKWGKLKDGTFFKGSVPEGYDLAVSPSKGMVVIDVDKHGKTNGFNNIPKELMVELKSTLNYPTKNGGRHFWFVYTGKENLQNKASNLSIDLRTHKGYVVWYPEDDIKRRLKDIKQTSTKLNTWLEEHFCKS